MESENNASPAPMTSSEPVCEDGLIPLGSAIEKSKLPFSVVDFKVSQEGLQAIIKAIMAEIGPK